MMPSHLLGWLLRGCSQPTDSRYPVNQVTNYTKLRSFIESKFVYHVSSNYCLFHSVTSEKPKPPPQDADTTKDGQGEVHVLMNSPSQLHGIRTRFPNKINMEPSTLQMIEISC